MKNEIKIGRKITYEDLNPHNFALKNRYVTNLLTTALAVIPTLEDFVGGSAYIKKGFTSKGYTTYEKGTPTPFESRLGEGLALVISVDPFDDMLVTAALKSVLRSSDARFKFTIDKDEKSVDIQRVKKTSEISERLPDGTERTIFKP